MALFTLADIGFNRNKEKDRSFDLGNINLNEKYRKNLLRYPIDVGNTDKAHYMVIHVNQQEKTIYKAELDDNTLPTIHQNRIGLTAKTGALTTGGIAGLGIDAAKTAADRATEAFQNQVNALDQKFDGRLSGIKDYVASSFTSALNNEVANYAFNAIGGAAKEAESMLGKLDNASYLRRIKRTTDSIALYMPNTLNFQQRQGYNTLAQGGENAQFYGAGASIINDAVRGSINAEQLGRNLTPFIAERLANRLSGVLGQNSTAGIFASAIGGVQNPRLELIYTSPEFRSFIFDFMFYPRDEKEALEVQHIIERLRFHQAPEIMTGTAGYFLVPPSEFDIEFYYNGEINPNIPKISTCVLTSLDVDYAPKGFHTFEVPNQNIASKGGTGMPFAIRMQLSFQETEIMTKYNFNTEKPTKSGGYIPSNSEFR